MWLIVGLGNPGKRYQETRHNIGFMVLEALADRYNIPLKPDRFQSITGQGSIEDQPVVLVLPQTYMNLSGQAVAPLSERHQVTPSNILVIHDELDLPFGLLRLKKGGGDGGHRGIRSISGELENKNYLRLRFGIDRPDDPQEEIVDFVLDPFSETEQQVLSEYITRGVKLIRDCCIEGVGPAMNLWHQKKSQVSLLETEED